MFAFNVSLFMYYYNHLYLINILYYSLYYIYLTKCTYIYNIEWLQKFELIKMVVSTSIGMGELFGVGGGLVGLAVGMAAIGIIGEDKNIDNGVDNEEDVDIKEKERENKGESVVEVDSEVDVGDNGWKDGEMMYLFGGDYGYKKEEDVRDQRIHELSTGSLRDEDVETIEIRSEFRLFGAHNIDRDGYIPRNEQNKEDDGLVFGRWFCDKKD